MECVVATHQHGPRLDAEGTSVLYWTFSPEATAFFTSQLSLPFLINHLVLSLCDDRVEPKPRETQFALLFGWV
jgi:hypothetical protein